MRLTNFPHRFRPASSVEKKKGKRLSEISNGHIDNRFYSDRLVRKKQAEAIQCCVEWLMDWLMDQKIDWTIDHSIDWWVDWLTGWWKIQPFTPYRLIHGGKWPAKNHRVLVIQVIICNIGDVKTYRPRVVSGGIGDESVRATCYGRHFSRTSNTGSHPPCPVKSSPVNC